MLGYDTETDWMSTSLLIGRVCQESGNVVFSLWDTVWKCSRFCYYSLCECLTLSHGGAECCILTLQYGWAHTSEKKTRISHFECLTSFPFITTGVPKVYHSGPPFYHCDVFFYGHKHCSCHKLFTPLLLVERTLCSLKLISCNYTHFVMGCKFS